MVLEYFTKLLSLAESRLNVCKKRDISMAAIYIFLTSKSEMPENKE